MYDITHSSQYLLQLIYAYTVYYKINGNNMLNTSFFIDSEWHESRGDYLEGLVDSQPSWRFLVILLYFMI